MRDRFLAEEGLMQQRDEVETMTAEQRLNAIARLLAVGVLRLRSQQATSMEVSLECAQNCLELGGESRLSGHHDG